MEARRVLGISLGTRKIGLAVLERCFIFECVVRSFPGAWSAKKQQRILALIEWHLVNFRVGQIAIKLPVIAVPAPNVTQLLAGIKTLAASHNIHLQICTLAELKNAWIPDTRMNKKKFMQCVVEKYPQLQDEYDRQMNSKVRHYEMLFEAVGVADSVCR